MRKKRFKSLELKQCIRRDAQQAKECFDIKDNTGENATSIAAAPSISSLVSAASSWKASAALTVKRKAFDLNIIRVARGKHIPQRCLKNKLKRNRVGM